MTATARKWRGIPSTARKGELPKYYPLQRQSTNIVCRRVESLPIFPELKQRMLRGESLTGMAREIFAAGYWPGISFWTVRDRLITYKNRKLLPAAQLKALSNIGAKKQYERLLMALDALAEMEALYRTQDKRIKKFVETEASLGIPMKQLDDSMRVALSILQTYRELQMEAGDVPRAPVEVNMSLEGRTMSLVEHRYGKESFQRVMSDPKKRAKIAGLFEKLGTSPLLQEAVEEWLEEPSKDGSTVTVGGDDEDVVEAHGQPGEEDRDPDSGPGIGGDRSRSEDPQPG